MSYEFTGPVMVQTVRTHRLCNGQVVGREIIDEIDLTKPIEMTLDMSFEWTLFVMRPEAKELGHMMLGDNSE